jgi:hypothetical protein
MKAMDILEKLGKTYAGAAAYRDVGRVIFPRRGEATIGQFRTAFLRSRGFRFEYREVPARRSLRDPSASRCFSLRVDRGKLVDVDGVERSRESLSLAVAQMTGITFGAAHCALRMLLPDEIGGRSLSEASSASFVRGYSIDGKPWSAIALAGGEAGEILVDHHFALRRVGHKSSAKPTAQIDPSKFDCVLTYEPELFDEEPPDMNMDW